MFQKEINLHKSDSKKKIIIDIQQKLKKHASHTSKPKNDMKIPQQMLVINLTNNFNKSNPNIVKSKSPKNANSKLTNIHNYNTKTINTIMFSNTNSKNLNKNKTTIKSDLFNNNYNLNNINNNQKTISMIKNQKLNTSLKKQGSKNSYREKTQSKKNIYPLNLNEKYQKTKNKVRNTSCKDNYTKTSIDFNTNNYNTKSNTIKKNKINQKIKNNSSKKSLYVVPACIKQNKYKNKSINKDNKNNSCTNQKNINVSSNNNNITINKNNTININNYLSSKNTSNDNCRYSAMVNNDILSEKYLNAQTKFRKNYFAAIIQKIYRGYLFRKNFMKLSKRKSIIIDLGENKNKNKTYNNNQFKKSISSDIKPKKVYIKKKVTDTCLYNKKIKNIFISSPKITHKINCIEEMNINICPSPKKIEEIIISRKKSNLLSPRNRYLMKTKSNFINNNENKFAIYNSDRRVSKNYERYYLFDAINFWKEKVNKRKIMEKLIEKYKNIRNPIKILLNKTFTQNMNWENLRINNSFNRFSERKNNIFLNEVEEKNYRFFIHSKSTESSRKKLEF